jgi:hypothetical protein
MLRDKFKTKTFYDVTNNQRKARINKFLLHQRGASTAISFALTDLYLPSTDTRYEVISSYRKGIKDRLMQGNTSAGV